MIEDLSLPEVFTYWSEPALSDAAEFSFDASDQAEAQIIYWRMDLPADAQLAAEHIAMAEKQAMAVQGKLAEIPSRIDSMLHAEVRSDQQLLEFSAPPESQPELPSAESDLLRWLENLEPGSVSFEAAAAPVEIESKTGEFRQQLEQMTRSLSNLAWIETQQSGRILARTAVDWTGDQHTTWIAASGVEEHYLHQQSLQLAITTRLTRIRALIVIVRGAARLATLATVPGGALLALPAIWKFTSQVLAELRN